MAKKFQRSMVDKLRYSPNRLTLPLNWRPSIKWKDIKNTPPSSWPEEAKKVLKKNRGGIYIFFDVTTNTYLYVGRSTNLFSRFANYQNANTRATQSISPIDTYERSHPRSEIWIYVAWCTEIEYMFIKSSKKAPLWNKHHTDRDDDAEQ